MSAAAPILFAICDADATVIGFLKTGSVLRFFPAGNVPQGQPSPYATYSTVGGRPANSMDSPSRADNARVQITIWDADFDTAALIAGAVRSALENAQAQSDRSVGIRTIAFNPHDYDSERKLFCDSFDVSVWTTN